MEQVEQHALQALGIGRHGREVVGEAAPHVDAAGLGLRVEGVDDLADEHGEAHPLRRPGDVASPRAWPRSKRSSMRPLSLAQAPVHALERDAVARRPG